MTHDNPSYFRVAIPSTFHCRGVLCSIVIEEAVASARKTSSKTINLRNLAGAWMANTPPLRIVFQARDVLGLASRLVKLFYIYNSLHNITTTITITIIVIITILVKWIVLYHCCASFFTSFCEFVTKCLWTCNPDRGLAFSAWHSLFWTRQIHIQIWLPLPQQSKTRQRHWQWQWQQLWLRLNDNTNNITMTCQWLDNYEQPTIVRVMSWVI